MVARQIHLATRDEKAAVDQLDDAPGQVARKVWAIVGRAVLTHPPRHKDFRKAIAHRQLHVGVGLVVAQQNIEARLALLDQVILKRQRLGLVAYQYVVEIDRLPHQRARLRIGLRRLQQIGPHPRAQILGLAYIDHLALGILVEIHSGVGRQRANFFVQVHGQLSQFLPSIARNGSPLLTATYATPGALPVP